MELRIFNSSTPFCLIGLLMTLSSSIALSQPTTQTYSNAGTFSWTCPAGVTSIDAELWGGGGGGGGSSTNSNGGSGGGGGAYVKKVNISVTPGNSYTVVVGAGGTAGSGTVPTIVAGKGGTSYFSSTSTAAAAGGCGALGNRGTAGAGACSGASTSTCIASIGDCTPTIAIYPNITTSGSAGSCSTPSPTPLRILHIRPSKTGEGNADDRLADTGHAQWRARTA